MWKKYYSVTSTEDALDILAENGERAIIVAGATDLILELERRIRPGIESLIDITRIPGLDGIWIDAYGVVHIGPLVTHNQCAVSKLIVEKAFLLAKAAYEVGAPQIRNRGTVAGNLITASPANDTITPLMALGAQVRLVSKNNERTVPLKKFYTGVRKTVMQPDEMMVDISFPAMEANQKGTFMKIGLRSAQAIAVVNAAVLVEFAGEIGTSINGNQIQKAAITLGAVAPTIVHARKAEEFITGRELTLETINGTAETAKNESHPIDDLRGSAKYRGEMVRVCVERCLQSISKGTEKQEYPSNPVTLQGECTKYGAQKLESAVIHQGNSKIKTRINGRDYSFNSGFDKTLLRLLREEAGLIGSKEGCAEGECGACTVFLDGMAVMSCLVPAVRAHNAEIITIEGLAENGVLHPVQKYFIEEGAVQCGYCTPGFIMSGAKLLEEIPHPSRSQVHQAITGNLCRCTGYYKIIEAIEKAGQ
jgi:carbon-monoxide dehydrogenase medium subunit